MIPWRRGKLRENSVNVEWRESLAPADLVLDIIGNKIDWEIGTLPGSLLFLENRECFLSNVGGFAETRDDFVKTISRWLVSRRPLSGLRSKQGL